MAVRVYKTGRHHSVLRVEHQCGLGVTELPERGDPVPYDAYIASLAGSPGPVDDQARPDDDVEHGSSSPSRQLPHNLCALCRICAMPWRQPYKPSTQRA